MLNITLITLCAAGLFFLRNYPWMFFSTGVAMFFTAYFSLMFVLHVRQIFRNITANEMENAWRYSYLKKEGRFHNPFDRGLTVNCAEAFMRPLVQQMTMQGNVVGSDGRVRSSPSEHYPDYYKCCDMSEVASTRTPTYRELVTLKSSSPHRKYEPLTQDDDEPDAADNV